MEPPAFVETLQPIHVFDGEQVVFSCIVTGTPAPTLTWMHDDTVIGVDDDFVIDYNVLTGKCECIIVESFPEDAGMFVCIAANPVGEATSAAELDITVPSEPGPNDLSTSEFEEPKKTPVPGENVIVPEVADKKQQPPVLEEHPSPEEVYPEITKSADLPTETREIKPMVTEEAIEVKPAERTPSGGGYTHGS